jgi:hypothetical protein
MINSPYLLLYTLFAVSLFSIFLIYWTAKQVPSNLEKWEKLPRNVYIGIVIAVIDLAICVPHSMPLVPVSMKSWLIPAAVIFTWLIYQFLDYIFSRAFGGFLILLAHYLLFASLAFQVPLKPVFSILCFAMGTLGIFFCGKPYLMRDLIRKIGTNDKWRYSAIGITALYAAIFLILGILQLTAEK